MSLPHLHSEQALQDGRNWKGGKVLVVPYFISPRMIGQCPVILPKLSDTELNVSSANSSDGVCSEKLLA